MILHCRRPARRALSVAALGLVLAWIGAPAAVPLYDGVGFPDQPYRFVQAPAGYPATPPPATATAMAPGAGGHNAQAFYATSSEQGPQASIYVSAGALAGPMGATSYSMSAVPLAPVGQPPLESIEGNVYRLSFTAGGQPATFASTPDNFCLIRLRALNSSQPGPGMVYRASPQQPWRSLTTNRSGMDVYESPLQGPGDYALARPAGGYSPDAGSPAPSAAGSATPTGVLVGLGALIAVVVAGLLGLRMRAGRRRR